VTEKKQRRRIVDRFGLRVQVMATLTIVGVVIALVGMVQTYQAHREASRGAFLNKHYNRFDAYRHGLGRALAGTAAVVAEAFPMAKAFGDGSAPQVAQRIGEALERTVDPDLLIVVDADAEPVTAPGLTEMSVSDAQRSRLVRDVLDGMTVAGEIAILDGRAYQVSAVPLRGAVGATPTPRPAPVDEGEEEAEPAAEPIAREGIAGAIIIGERLKKHLEDYRRQSDPNQEKQHRLSLVARDGSVLASVFPAAEHGALATALQEGNWQRAREGDGFVDVIHHEGHVYDFHREEVRGYQGSEHGDLGSIFLMRTRDHKIEKFEERARDSIVTLSLVVLLTLLVGAALAWWITRRINRYVTATEDLARGRGDLTQRLSVDRRDELGRLAENLNDMFGYIHGLAAKVQRAAFQVGASSAQISAASRTMLEGAREQASKTEGSTAAVTELSASIQQVAENATQASRVARSSGEAVRNAIARMQEIRGTVDEAAARIHELGESGKRIGNIVEVIRQISDQTTLLALNAAIEAAHAGEQGRGFAVVADEVSGLANRVGQSARDIEDLIATITEQTVEAVRAMEAGTREVDEGTRLVTSTLGDLEGLVQVVEDTARAVQEQAVASDEIARNMDVVQRIAQDVLGSSEEAVEQGEHLHRLAHGLEESVKGFRIDEEGKDEPPPPPKLGSGE